MKRFYGLILQIVIETNSEMGTLDHAVRAELRRLLKGTGIKQDAIAAATGKSQSGMSQYLSGKRGKRATLDDLEALAGFVDKTLADVLVAVRTGKPLQLRADDAWIALRRALTDDERKQFATSMKAVIHARVKASKASRKPARNTE